MNRLQRVLAINDISCFGRCSLTVALPTISSCGVETVILPTSVLSTHTGGFTGFTLRDLASDIKPILNHWLKEEIDFDAIYTGYLANASQIEEVLNVLNSYKSSKIIVDPAMADNGKLYYGFGKEFPSEMAKLVKVSDVCLPNITEACFLTDSLYLDGVQSEEYYLSLADKLLALGSKCVVLTGVKTEAGKVGVLVKDSKSYTFYLEDEIPHNFHGTGDLFSSIFTGAYIKGLAIIDAAKVSVSLTRLAILETIPYSCDSKYGVNFELILPDIKERIEEML